MKKIILLIILMSFYFNSNAQYDKMLDILEDTETEENENMFTLRFLNAITGEPVQDAIIGFGGEIGNFQTDADGKIMFEKNNEDGIYKFNFSKNGFIDAQYEYEVIAGTVFFNRFSVCPKTELGALRIVLDWGKSPADLDLHLIKEGEYHISYRNKHSSADGAVKIDKDDQNGYGPETITLKSTDKQAYYQCNVSDYSNKENSNALDLSKSKAVLRVYNDNKLSDTFYVPMNSKGNLWNAFVIESGRITGIYKIIPSTL